MFLTIALVLTSFDLSRGQMWTAAALKVVSVKFPPLSASEQCAQRKSINDLIFSSESHFALVESVDMRRKQKLSVAVRSTAEFLIRL